MGPGMSFSPFNQPQQGQPRPNDVPPQQQAIQTLSLRRPTVAGASAPTPLPGIGATANPLAALQNNPAAMNWILALFGGHPMPSGAPMMPPLGGGMPGGGMPPPQLPSPGIDINRQIRPAPPPLDVTKIGAPTANPIQIPSWRDWLQPLQTPGGNVSAGGGGTMPPTFTPY